MENKLRERRQPRRGPRTKRTAERPNTPSQCMIARRRKQNCYQRKVDFIKLLFVDYGSDVAKVPRPYVKEAARLAGISSMKAAQ